MQRLAALVPRARLHLIRDHGVLAPYAGLRAEIVPGRVHNASVPADEHAQGAPVRIGRARPALDELDAWRSRGVTVLWVPIDGQCAGAIAVAMAGDGVNDATALAAAAMSLSSVSEVGYCHADAFAPHGGAGGAGRLSQAQAARIRKLIIDSLPDQLKLPFYLWTRAAVVTLIGREYGVTVSLTTVGRYLNGWGMSPQKPVRRAYERNDAAIGRWLRTEYPAIARQARQEKAVIYRGDEMGLRSDHASGTSFAPRGQTLIVRATGQRFGCNMIPAITNRGHLAFMAFHGKFDGRLFIRFMQRLVKQAPGKLYLIVDCHPVHRSVAAKKFVSANEERLRLIRLPGYCPEINPDELLNQDVKTNGLGKSRPSNRTEMMAGVRSHLRRRQRQLQVIRNLFQEKHVRYAA